MKLREVYERCKKHILSLLTVLKNTLKYTINISIAIILLLFIIYILQEIPHWQVAEFGITNPRDLAEMENSYRATFAQIIGGSAVLVTLYFTWRNLTTAREGQITERFTRAIDQLENIKLEIRLGGIFALERISNESDKDYWPIMEILTAYIRKNSPIRKGLKENYLATELVSMDIQANESIKREIPEERTLSLDIQAILTVLGRRRKSYGKGELERLNLHNTYLEGANLGWARLEEANLYTVNLEGANLGWARLEGANLLGAHLEEANLMYAHLEGAYLMDAHLKRAYLSRAHLEGANLAKADLEGADLAEADLEGAKLSGADLEGARLNKAHLNKAHLNVAHLEEADLFWANLEEANLFWANLEGASLLGAHLKGATGLEVDQLSKVRTLYKAKLDENLRIQLEEKCPALFDEPDLSVFDIGRFEYRL